RPKRIGEVVLLVLMEDGAVSSDLDRDRAGRLALNGDRLGERLERLPRAAIFHLAGVRRVQLLDEDVRLIGARRRASPGDPAIVTADDPRKPWFSGADHAPTRRLEMYHVAPCGQRHLAVRIIDHERL